MGVDEVGVDEMGSRTPLPFLNMENTSVPISQCFSVCF